MSAGKQTAGRAAQLVLLLFVSAAVCAVLVFFATGRDAYTDNVSCAVIQDTDGDALRNVNVQNTGTEEAWLRVRLLTYRVNEQGQRIGGTAALPPFTPGEDWFVQGAFCYYRFPVAPGQMPPAALIGAAGIPLAHYTDADGGTQVIEVMADAHPADRRVADDWGVQLVKSDNGNAISPMS